MSKKKNVSNVLHEIDNFEGKIENKIFFLNNYAEICLVYCFFAEYYGFSETEIFFF